MSATATALSIDRPNLAAERRFFLVMTLAMAAAVLLGFARSFYLRPLFPDWPSPHETIFYVHGAVFTAWFALLVTQASLINLGRVQLHRTLGALGIVLASLMVVLGTSGALIAARRASGFVDIPVPPLQFLVVPIVDMIFFATMIAIAVAKRNNAQSHKRAMYIASAGLLTAAVARWPIVHGSGVLVYFGIADLFIVALVIWDLVTRRRMHRMTIWAGAALIFSQPLRLALSLTPAWLGFAHWASGVPG